MMKKTYIYIIAIEDEEFLAFADCTTKAAAELRKKRAGKSDKGMVLSTIRLDPVSHYQSKKFTVEANKCGAYHVHYRDFRLDFYAPEEIEYFLSRMVEGYKSFIQYRLQSKVRVCLSVPLSIINPFDADHRLLMPGERFKYDQELFRHGHFMAPPNELHNKRIDQVIKAIQAGKIIRPIACRWGDPILQRKDGFCRYWAHKVLGIKYIDCIIGKQTIPGVQGGKDFVVSKEKYAQLLRGEGY